MTEIFRAIVVRPMDWDPSQLKPIVYLVPSDGVNFFEDCLRKVVPPGMNITLSCCFHKKRAYNFVVRLAALLNSDIVLGRVPVIPDDFIEPAVADMEE
jgi:hypothetical protein